MPNISKLNPMKRAMESPKSSIIDRLEDMWFGENDGLSLLLYGASGSGKTTTWATFPKPILAVVCSGGKKKGELRSIDTPEYRKVIKPVALKSSEEFKDIIEFAKGGEFKTIVLDHISGFQDLILSEVSGFEEIPIQKSWGMSSQEDYRECSGRTKTYIKNLLDLSINKVIIAHEKQFSVEGMQDIIKPTVGALVQPAIWEWLNGAVDYVGQSFRRPEETTKEIIVRNKQGKKVIKKSKERTGNTEYCMRINDPNLVFFTKFRVPKGGTPFPDVITDPSYNKIIGMIRKRQQEVNTNGLADVNGEIDN